MNALAKYLKAKGITQEQFAARLGVTQGTVSKMCRPGAVIRDEMKLKVHRLTDGAVPAESWLRSITTRDPLAPPPASDKETGPDRVAEAKIA